MTSTTRNVAVWFSMALLYLAGAGYTAVDILSAHTPPEEG